MDGLRVIEFPAQVGPGGSEPDSSSNLIFAHPLLDEPLGEVSSLLNLDLRTQYARKLAGLNV